MRSRLIALACLGLMACGPTASGSAGRSPNPSPTVVGAHEVMLNAGGRDRTYLVFRPASLNPKLPAPLVLALHGYTENAPTMEGATGLDEEAVKAGFVVVYPQGNDNSWNAGTCCSSAQAENLDDVGFIRQIIDQLVTAGQVDPSRVFVTGLSNGGLMAYRLACELSDRIAAIASVSGAMVATHCHPARPVSVLEMHGADDPLIPIDGGSIFGLGSFPATLATLQRWAGLDGCGRTPTVTEDGITTISTWNGCREGVHVVLEVIKGAGHSWFGPADYIPGEPDANEVVWDFFSHAPARA